MEVVAEDKWNANGSLAEGIGAWPGSTCGSATEDEGETSQNSKWKSHERS